MTNPRKRPDKMSVGLDRAARRIRHLPFLDRANWLWNSIRPAYDAVLRATARQSGLERHINGTDRFRIAPASRRLVGNCYEPEVWALTMSLIRPGDTIVDVGAHIGIYAIAFALRAGSNGRVIAIEADPANADLMEANVAVNQLRNLEIVRAAAGDHAGSVRFASLNSKISHVVGLTNHNAAVSAGEAARGEIGVPMITLDSQLAGQQVDFIKIDVEGFEEAVLKGARELLADSKRRPRAILIEVHPYAWESMSTTSESLTSFMEQCGYRTETLDGRPRPLITSYGHLLAFPLHESPELSRRPPAAGS